MKKYIIIFLVVLAIIAPAYTVDKGPDKLREYDDRITDPLYIEGSCDYNKSFLEIKDYDDSVLTWDEMKKITPLNLKIEWIEGCMVTGFDLKKDKYTQFIPTYKEDVQLGLREDGIVVWRYVDE